MITMVNLVFKAYATPVFSEAEKAYLRQFGVKPTAFVVRHEFTSRERDDDRIVRTRFGASGLILVTHILTPSELVGFYSLAEANRAVVGRPSIAKDDVISRAIEVPKHAAGRPKGGGGTCPMCKRTVEDFDELGWWWGWGDGIEPPYWEELRAFVFRRDDYKCHSCGKQFPMSYLVSHHIIAKEVGGADSARNLTTLCSACHPDTKPIFDEDI